MIILIRLNTRKNSGLRPIKLCQWHEFTAPTKFNANRCVSQPAIKCIKTNTKSNKKQTTPEEHTYRQTLKIQASRQHKLKRKVDLVVQFREFWTAGLYGDEWSASCSGCLYLERSISLCCKVSGSQSTSVRTDKGKNLNAPTRYQLRSSNSWPVTDWAITTTII
jgi:hypothetical protein